MVINIPTNPFCSRKLHPLLNEKPRDFCKFMRKILIGSLPHTILTQKTNSSCVKITEFERTSYKIQITKKQYRKISS